MPLVGPTIADPFASESAPSGRFVGPVLADPFAEEGPGRTLTGHLAEVGPGVASGAVEAVGTGLRGAAARIEPWGPRYAELLAEIERADIPQGTTVDDLAARFEAQPSPLDAMTGPGPMRRAEPANPLAALDEAIRFAGIPNEKRTVLRQALRGRIEGRPGALDAARAGRATPVQERELWHAGESVSEFAQERFGAAPGYEDSPVRVVSEGVGSLAAGVGVSLAGGPAAGPVMATALFASMGAGEAADRAVQAGASDEQIAEAALLGLGAGSTDVLPVEVLLRRLPVPGARAVGEAVRRFGGAKTLAALGRIGTQVAVEAVQEGGQQALQNLIAREVHSPDQRIGEGIVPSAAVGGAVGGVAGLTREGVLAIANRRSGSARGARARAVADVPPPSPSDEASPIPTADIQAGREEVADAQATAAVNQWLAAEGLPAIGQPVRIVRGREVVEGIVTDAWDDDGGGLTVTTPDGTVMDASRAELDTMGARVEVLTMPPSAEEIDQVEAERAKEADGIARLEAKMAEREEREMQRYEAVTRREQPRETTEAAEPPRVFAVDEEGVRRAVGPDAGQVQGALAGESPTPRGEDMQDALAGESPTPPEDALQGALAGDPPTLAGDTAQAGFAGRRPQAESTAAELDEAEPVDTAPIMRKNGEPFKTEKSAALAARNMGIIAEPVRVGDGWALRRTPPEEKAARALQVLPNTRTESFTPDGSMAVETELAVVDAVDLIVSHDEQGRPDPRYPSDLQPRERKRATSQAQIREIAGALKPGMLRDSPMTDTGAPIVGPDAAVESGNGRVAAIRLAYRRGYAADYRAMVEREAERSGVDATAMKAPVLVRVRRGGVADRAQFARASNVSAAARMSASERAKADVETAGRDVLEEYARDPRRAEGRFVESLPSAERSAMFDAEGRPSKELRDRVRNAVLWQAYGSDSILRAAAEAEDPDGKQLLNALITASPKFAEVEDGVKTALNAAVDRIATARARGMNNKQMLEQVIGQQELIADETFDSGARAIARHILERARSGKRTGEYLVELAERAQRAEESRSYGGMDLLGEVPEVDIAVLAGQADEAAGAVVEVQDAMFQRPPTPSALSAFLESQKGLSLSERYRRAPLNQILLNGTVRRIARTVDAEALTPQPKARDVAEAKIRRKRYPDASRLTDIERAAIVVDSLEDANRTAELLGRRFETLDEGWSVKEEFYIDRKVLVRFPNGSIGEVQILTRAMKDAKKTTHKLYVRQRELERGSAEWSKLFDQQRRIHAAAVRASGLSGIVEASAYGNAFANQSGQTTDAVWLTSAADSRLSSSQPERSSTMAKTRPSRRATAGRASQSNQVTTSDIAGTSETIIGGPGTRFQRAPDDPGTIDAFDVDADARAALGRMGEDDAQIRSWQLFDEDAPPPKQPRRREPVRDPYTRDAFDPQGTLFRRGERAATDAEISTYAERFKDARRPEELADIAEEIRRERPEVNAFVRDSAVGETLYSGTREFFRTWGRPGSGVKMWASSDPSIARSYSPYEDRGVPTPAGEGGVQPVVVALDKAIVVEGRDRMFLDLQVDTDTLSFHGLTPDEEARAIEVAREMFADFDSPIETEEEYYDAAEEGTARPLGNTDTDRVAEFGERLRSEGIDIDGINFAWVVDPGGATNMGEGEPSMVVAVLNEKKIKSLAARTFDPTQEDTYFQRDAATAAETQPARPATRIRLQRRFDNASAGVKVDIEREGRRAFGDRFNVRLAERIDIGDGSVAPGAFDPSTRIAYIALRVDQPGAMRGSLYHEGLHYLRAAGAFSRADGTPNAAWKTLEREAPKWRKKYQIDERYGDDAARLGAAAGEDMMNEEAIAEALADYATRGKETGFSATVRMAFDRILRFFRAVRNALAGRGFTDWTDVFEDIESGAFGRTADAAARQPSRAEADRYLQTAWHGSPHRFDRFSVDAIGSGEGAQAFGHGLYFAGRKDIADFYRGKLSGITIDFKGRPLSFLRTALLGKEDSVAQLRRHLRRELKASGVKATEADGDAVSEAVGYLNMAARLENSKEGLRKRMEQGTSITRYGLPNRPAQTVVFEEIERLLDDGTLSVSRTGATYRVDLAPAEDEYLVWDESFDKQSDKVKSVLEENRGEFFGHLKGSTKGATIYNMLAQRRRGEPGASKWLGERGIRGVKYKDARSRGREGGTFNYVIFDDSDVAIEEVLLQRAWHGSPHRFDRFSTDAIGTGEGVQVYGHGLYFSGRKEIADWYRNQLAGSGETRIRGEPVQDVLKREAARGDHVFIRMGKSVRAGHSFERAKADALSEVDRMLDDTRGQTGLIQRYENIKEDERAMYLEGLRRDERAWSNTRRLVESINEGDIESEPGGAVYRVDLAPAEDEYLLWDEPFSAQSAKVRDVLTTLWEQDVARFKAANQQMFKHVAPYSLREDTTGEGIYTSVTGTARFGRPEEGSKKLLAAGIRGIKYKDATTRHKPQTLPTNVFLSKMGPEVSDAEQALADGVFDPEEETVVRALQRHEWLGERYADAAVHVALEGGRGVPKEVRDAIRVLKARNNQGYNYVIFDDADVTIEQALLQRGKDTPKANKDAFDDAASKWAGADLRGAADAVIKDKDRMGGLAEGIAAQVKGADAIKAKNVEVQEQLDQADLNVALRMLGPPRAWSKKFPAIHKLVRAGIRGEIALSNRVQRLNREWDRITKGLSKDEFADLTGLMFLGDAEAHTFNDAELAQFPVTDNVRRAYRRSRRFIDKLGRLVEQHNRDMSLALITRRTKLVRKMAGARGMDPKAFRKLYDERARLLAEQRTGEGDPEALAERIDAATERLHGTAEPSAEYAEWAAEADRIQPRIDDTRIRRREGYVPHKFFGRWRIFREVPEDEARTVLGFNNQPYQSRKSAERAAEANGGGEVVEVEGGWGYRSRWAHVAGEHGFWRTRTEAVRAASHMAKDGARLRVAQVQFVFPEDQATQLSDAAYHRFQGNVRKLLELEGEDLQEAVRGTARKRFRRRIAGFSQYRKGVAGYSQDLDRVIRTHIGETMRYVSLDRLKFDAINTMEREGLSENRSTVQDRPVLAAAVQQWFRDVNGQKQILEGQVDQWLDKPWATPLRAALGAGGVTFVATHAAGAPLVAPILGAYVGYRVGRGLAQGGPFKSRAITGAMLGDMSHLKLGMTFNLMSAAVNTTQVLLNTYPVLGARHTAVGIKRFNRAVLSKIRGKPNADWRLMERHDINPLQNMAEGTRHQFQKEGMLSKLSMIWFTGAENFNRGVTFLGAVNKAQQEGRSARDAQNFADEIMLRTQFHYGASNKPELLRNNFARVPLQFKNFVAQQLTFVFGLSRAELPRFLLATVLVAGTLGIPGLDALDALMDWLFDYSPIAAMKGAAIDALAKGELEGGIATFLTRGVPGLAGVDMTGRVGMGDKFLPLQVRDWKGPWSSTVSNAVRYGAEGARLVDHLRNVSPGVGNPLKTLEEWANGGVQRSPWKRNRPEYTMTGGEAAMKAIGARPMREARLQDLRDIERREVERRRREVRRYVDRIVEAERAGDRAEVRRIQAEARAAGVPLSRASLRRAFRDIETPRADRELRQLPRDMRGEGLRRRDAIERAAVGDSP